MTSPEPDAALQMWVLRVDVVRSSLRYLTGRPTHEWFPAYLHLVQQAGITRNSEAIRPKWQSFGRLLRVDGAPESKPYLRPFMSDATATDSAYWLNKNLAGSWAPSSLAPGASPLAVVTVNADKSFALRDNHLQLAFRLLLFEKRLSAPALAAFLLRDYGFTTAPGTEPDVNDLLGAFRAMFYLENRSLLTLFDEFWPSEIENRHPSQSHLFVPFEDVAG